MKVEVLASVMHGGLDDVVGRMKIDSDAVIICQSDRFYEEERIIDGKDIRFYSFRERGIGKSRNEAIMRAKGDICLFSDEDIVYEEGYQEAILREFVQNSKADMILFNIAIGEERATYRNTKRKRVHWYNCGRYGAVSFAVKRDSLLKSGVMFSQLFGGGAKYCNGEDSLFLKEFMGKGYKVYASPMLIGRETEGDSSWFQGYDEKFFHDRGVLYHFLYHKMAIPFALRFLLAHKEKLCKETGMWQAFRWMREGISEVG